MHRLVVAVAAALALGAGTETGAVRLPGDRAAQGKAAHSDCYATFDVKGPRTATGNRVECADGDPTCDAAAACDGDTDGQCVFRVRFCVNDVGTAPACAPVEVKRVSSRPKLDSTGVSLPTASAACGTFTDVVVKTRRGGSRPRDGKRVIRMLARSTNGRPRADTDAAVLVCRAGKPKAACPPVCGDGRREGGEACEPALVPNGCPAATPRCAVDCTCGAACEAGGRTFTKLAFTTSPGSTSCGGPGVTQHCRNGAGGTDGHGSCTVDGDCGPMPRPGECAGGPPPSGPFTGEVDDAAGAMLPGANLARSCLYIGGGLSSTAPAGNPDGATMHFEAFRDPATAGRCVLKATAGDRLTCTAKAGPERHCQGGEPGTDGAGACADDRDCCITAPDGRTTCGQADEFISCALDANCHFGPPLPIANGVLSTCTLNVIDAHGSGSVTPAGGAITITLPLSSRVYLTSNATAPCPQCVSGACQGGRNDGKPCTPVGALLTSFDCPPPDPLFVGPIPVTLADMTTGLSMQAADANGLFCASVGQRFAGAFGLGLARTVKENGVAAASLLDGAPHDAVLASTFCIPASGDGAIDAVADLPGPGATSLPGQATLLP